MQYVKAVIDIIKIAIDAWKFISGQISEAKFRNAIKKRKENFDTFMHGNRLDKLKVLKDENKTK